MATENVFEVMLILQYESAPLPHTTEVSDSNLGEDMDSTKPQCETRTAYALTVEHYTGFISNASDQAAKW